MAIVLQGDGSPQATQTGTNDQYVEKMRAHGHFTLQGSDNFSPPGAVPAYSVSNMLCSIEPLG